MNQPLVSICIPAYNAEAYIKETLAYWQQQDYHHLEIIVQDDCSKDETYLLAKQTAEHDNRIKVYQNSKNLGIGDNWNAAYEKANGDYIVIANADDIYHSHLLSNALSIFNKNQEIDSVSFRYLIHHENTNSTHELEVHQNLEEGIQENLFKTCFFHNPFHIVFSVFKKKSLNKILLDSHQLFLNTQICDAELFFRIGKNKFKHYYTNYIAGKYRKHNTNNSYKPNGESYSWLYYVFPIYRNHLLLNYPQETSLLLRNKIFHQFKFSIRYFKSFDIKQISTLFKEYLFFKKKHD